MQLRVKPSVWITTSGLSPPWTLSTARIRISSSVLWSRARASRRFMPHYTLCLLTYDVVNSPGSGIVSKLVRNDVGGNTDGSGDIVKVGAQSFHQGLLAAVACQQPAVGGEGIERAEEA